MIENGDISSGQLSTACKRILEPIKNSSHILLACTHYPAILPLLRECVSRQTFFIDPAPELVGSLREWDLERGNGDTYLTTGDAGKMKEAAKAAFDWDIGSVTQVGI